MKPRLLSAARLSFPLAIAIAVLIAIPAAHAVDYSWDGGHSSGQWSNVNNWVGNPATVTFSASTNIFFYELAAARIASNYLAADRTIGSLTFNDNADGTVLIRLATTSGGGSGAADLTVPLITVNSGASGNITIGGSDGSVILTANLAVAHNGSGNLTIDRPITGAYSLTKSGTGRMVLSGANTYSAGTFISAGTLALSGGNNILGDTRAVNINNAAGTFDISAITTSETIGSLTGVASSKVVLGSKNLTVGATTSAYAGDISGTLGTLTKNGAATLSLSGNNSYTGGTTVSSGTLLINGNSSTATGAVAVNGGTLGGTGRSGGAVTVGATATLSPGASIESLDIASLSMASTSIFAYEVADNSTTGADLLASRTTLSLTGVTLSFDLASAAALSGGGWTLGNKLTLISYLGPDVTSGFTGYLDDTNYSFGSNLWRFNYNDTVKGNNFGADADAGGQDRFVTLTVVPEPNVAALLGGLGALALLRRRR